ncbi:MAG TPA: DUF1189 family protein [bacterium]|nr:DUF1189 family protein [bacterium]
MNLFLAPFYALFSLDFYRGIIQSRLSKGFLYLLYLSAIGTFLMSLWFVRQGIPQMNRFVEWAKTEMPSLTWTPEGLVMNAQSPYSMVHPDLGPLVMFDMNLTDIDVGTMQNVVMFVTSKKIFVRQGVNQIKSYDLTRTTPAAKGEEDGGVVAIDGSALQKFYDSVKPWFVVLSIIFFFFFFVVWKCLTAFLYSWVGLLINFLRRPKLNYSAVLNVTFFAITAATLIQALQALVPFLGRLPFGLAGSFIVTTAYLYLAIKKTEDQNLEGSPVPASGSL